MSSYIAWDKMLSNENRDGLEEKILTRKSEMEIVLWKMGRDKNSTLSQ